MKKIKTILFIIALLLLVSGCEKKKEEEIMPEENPIVTMNIKDYGTLTIELYPEFAPNTVANFVNLIESKFYDNNTIHRVQKKFVLQGGDPTGTGTGNPGYTINGEFSANGYTKNTLSHTKGVISMARGKNPNSAGCQFFIVLEDNAKYSLDGKYAGFGKVTEGLEVIDKIAGEKFKYTDESIGILKKPLTIESVTVDTKEGKYKVKKAS